MSIRRICDDFFTIGDIAILQKIIGNTGYDFPFRNHFTCRSVISYNDKPVLLRIGAPDDYTSVEKLLKEMDMALLMPLEDHLRCSEIENWYPLLKDKTPYTRIYGELPPVEELAEHFSFPVFIKGSRQTDRHNRSKCIIEDAVAYQELRSDWKKSRILSWQKAAVREYVPLQTIDSESFPNMVPISYEFCLFYYMGKCMEYGPYWTMGTPYTLAESDYKAVMELSKWAADRLKVPFAAIDVAKTSDGEWTIIEVNDGQESGFVGINPLVLWKNIVEAAQSKKIGLELNDTAWKND